MKKGRSKLLIGIVCAILGFLLTYQFKVIYMRNKQVDYVKQNSEIVQENEDLKKQKEDYTARIDDLEKKIADYENAAASRDEQSNLLIRDLEQSRVLMGSTDVQGEGVIVDIIPKSKIFGSNFEVQPINDIDLLRIVNELYAAGAEAISINDIRLTSTSGIRNAGNTIIVNEVRISYNEKVTIKAIGNKKLLMAALNFAGNIPRMLWELCDIEMKDSENIEIAKSNSTVEFKYVKPVEK